MPQPVEIDPAFEIDRHVAVRGIASPIAGEFSSRCSGRIGCGFNAFETFMGDDRLGLLQSIAPRFIGSVKDAERRGDMPAIGRWRDRKHVGNGAQQQKRNRT